MFSIFVKRTRAQAMKTLSKSAVDSQQLKSFSERKIPSVPILKTRSTKKPVIASQL